MTKATLTTATGSITVDHVVMPDPYQALCDIVRALKIDDHDAHCSIPDDDSEEELTLYEVWLAGNYAGCYSCVAAFIARAALERKDYPPIKWPDPEGM